LAASSRRQQTTSSLVPVRAERHDEAPHTRYASVRLLGTTRWTTHLRAASSPNHRNFPAAKFLNQSVRVSEA
jgi:hypothetical protein